ncbi:macrolide 2'-phosphotransferase [Arthrobacter sp. E3]|uniref:macrolide 2'-phosphotransferase n=1 Tax=Arthrobacter sp. E3 TaxID=517402 RepID=UPI001A94B80C|nr:macrolide 2'-phosphotransferase [Arthrobacter sp. E3]
MTAIELAAIASAAVPGLNVTAFGPGPDDAADFCSALLVDSEKRRWRVRSPRHAEASTRLETERQVLRAFSPAIRAELPFLLPTVAGTVRQGELITFVYSHIVGKAESVEYLADGSDALAKEIGVALAAIHDLPQGLVTTHDLPSYTANEFRQRKLNELDQSATTGKIPPSLLRRWEHAMEDVALWRFNPCVVHGDLHEDNILLDRDKVTAVMGWTELRIGDPADDFAWLVAVHEPRFVDAVMHAYALARHETPDPHLLRRAALSAEFALAQWLVKGYAADSARMVEDAESMLRTLEADITEHGGQAISVEPPAAQPFVASAPTAEAKAVPEVKPVTAAQPAGPKASAAPKTTAAAETSSAAKPVDVTAPGAAVRDADAPAATGPAFAPASGSAEQGTKTDTKLEKDALKEGAADTAEGRDAAATTGDTSSADTTALNVVPLKREK